MQGAACVLAHGLGALQPRSSLALLTLLVKQPGVSAVRGSVMDTPSWAVLCPLGHPAGRWHPPGTVGHETLPKGHICAFLRESSHCKG